MRNRDCDGRTIVNEPRQQEDKEEDCRGGGETERTTRERR
jgi:hypothetical protein